jgi:hypothetical protein
LKSTSQSPNRQTGSPARDERRSCARMRARSSRAERLGDVVVGAGIEPELLFGFLGSRRKQDDGRGDAGAPQLAAHVEAVHPGQHHVEQNEVPIARLAKL